MDYHELIKSLKTSDGGKIVMLVSDGIGGLPLTPGGKTELETAKTPNLDAMAAKGVSGMSLPILPGITPGSGPGHLGLFGYDPLKYQIGRGVLEAAGIAFPVGPNDVCLRCNFCTLGADGLIADRRAGRIPTEESTEVVKLLEAVKIPEVEIFVRPVKEHRFVVVFRAEGLGGEVADTDPQKVGLAPLPAKAKDPNDAASVKTAEVANEFYRQAKEILKDQPKANCLTMRGFAKKPNLPSYEDLYGLKAAAIAVYPMYKGLASLVGMELVGTPQSLTEEIEVLKQYWNDYDFFFVHFKYTDSRGEDGDFNEKVRMIEELDKVVPAIEALGPACFIVTGDHSTPAKMSGHSFHPVPTMIVSDLARTDACQAYGETEATRGGLGQFQAMYLMSLAMGHAGRLGKFGA